MQVYIDHIPELDSIDLFHLFAIYFYFSCAEPFIDTPKRSFRKIFFQEFIDALICIGWVLYRDGTHREVRVSIIEGRRSRGRYLS
jgi:hypothetical protein